MKLMIDACSLINLHKGGVLDVALKLEDHAFSVEGFVDEESGLFLEPYYYLRFADETF